jgi:predicted RNase H-like nuclease (RuvC/YqgF family)
LVSNPEDKGGAAAPDEGAFERLEQAVETAVTQLKDLKVRLGESAAEGREMKELLRRFTEGEEDPSRLLTRLKELETQNQELLARLEKGKEGVERLLARVRFLEEQG